MSSNSLSEFLVPIVGLLIVLGAIAGLLIVLGAIAGFAPLLQNKGKPPTDYPYTSSKYLFSKAERSFLGVLESAVPEGCRVLGKVRVADLVKVNKGLSRSSWQRAFNHISGKHVDFVICDATDIQILAVVELDDKSHRESSRKSRDTFLAGTFGAAGIPLIRFPAKAAYTASEVRESIAKALQGPEN